MMKNKKGKKAKTLKSSRKTSSKARHAVTKKPKKDANHPGWIALEVNPRGESEKDIESMVELIRKNLGRPKIEVFVPIYYKSDEFFEKNVTFLDGYFFIKFEPGLPYHKFNETKYFQGIVINYTTKQPQVIPHEQVLKIQEKFQKSIKEKTKYKKGQPIVILDGLYKGLDGEIEKIYKEEEYCVVSITSLKSRNIQVSVPLVSIEYKGQLDDNVSRVPTFFQKDKD